MRMSRPAPSPVLRASCVLLAVLATGGLGCAGGASDRFARAHRSEAPQPPTLGAAFGETIAALWAEPGEDASISVDEIRALRIDEEPWTPVSLEEAEPSSGRIGVIAARTCRIRVDWRRQETQASSWFVFEGGALRAFGHDAFGPRCERQRSLRPASESLVAAERGLVRYIGQRYPRIRPKPLELAAEGFAYLEVGRLAEVRHVLRGLDREIDRLENEQETNYRLSDAEIAELETIEEAVRTERAKLRRALRRLDEADAEADSGDAG